MSNIYEKAIVLDKYLGAFDLQYDVTTFIAPSVPILSITGHTTTSVSLEWDEPDTAIYYNLYHGTSSGMEVAIATRIIGTTYTVTGLSAGTHYFYIRAVDTYRISNQSSEVSQTI